MLRRRLFILSALLLMPLATRVVAQDLSIDAQLEELRQSHGIQVHYTYSRENYFPEHWLKPHQSLEAEEIELSEARRMVPIIEQFFRAHPAQVLQANLQNIYLLRSLSFRGVAYGSTYDKSSRSMYITCQSLLTGHTDQFLSQRLHSEFSSLLFEGYNFPKEAWAAINPAKFTYSGSGFEALGQPLLYSGTNKRRSNGFLLKYSRSSMENDFNMLSSWLFTKPGELEAVCRQHEKILQKRELTQSFYRSISSQYRFD